MYILYELQYHDLFENAIISGIWHGMVQIGTKDISYLSTGVKSE